MYIQFIYIYLYIFILIYILRAMECGQRNFGLFYLLHFELDLNSSSDSFVLLSLGIGNVSEQGVCQLNVRIKALLNSFD